MPTGAPNCFTQPAAEELFKGNHGGPRYPGSNGGFELRFGGLSGYQPGCSYTVSLCPLASSNRFKGFFLSSQIPPNATSNGNSIRVGSFNVSDSSYQAISCFGSPTGTLTHTSPSPKGALNFRWLAPRLPSQGPIALNLRIVRLAMDDWLYYSLSVPFSDDVGECPEIPESACEAPCDDMDGMTGMCDASLYGGLGGPWTLTPHNHDDHDDESAHDHSSSPSHSHSSMLFTTKFETVQLFFTEWDNSESLNYGISIAFVFFFAVLSEILRFSRPAVEAALWRLAEKRRQTKQENERALVSGRPPNSSEALAEQPRPPRIESSVIPPNDFHCPSSSPSNKEGAGRSANAASYNRPEERNQERALHIPERKAPIWFIVALAMFCGVRVFIGLSLMVIFMSLDVGLVCAILAGHIIGFAVESRNRFIPPENIKNLGHDEIGDGVACT